MPIEHLTFILRLLARRANLVPFVFEFFVLSIYVVFIPKRSHAPVNLVGFKIHSDLIEFFKHGFIFL
jgi:hypothetical protein